jgi:hypothetical protein
MNGPVGETVLLTSIASVILVGAVREVFLFARWVRSPKKFRTDEFSDR